MTMPVRGATLAKVTVVTPKRTIDVALPEDVTVAELLPYLLRHAGEDAADDGERHGGWVLRRPTGEALDSQRTLAAQDVRDGELLHLGPGQAEWPEISYDDLVEAIASGSRRFGRSWGNTATRRCGLALTAAILLAGSLGGLLFRPPWLVPGIVMLSGAAVLMAIGVTIARAVPDAWAGVVFAGGSLPYAFIGGYQLTAPSHLPMGAFGSPQLLLGTIALLVFGVVGYVSIAVAGRVFIAAILIGVLGSLGALLAGSMTAAGAASVVLAVGIGLLPGYPMLAMRLGRLPLPELPQRAADLLKEDKQPPSPVVVAAVGRTDEVLSGLLTGVAVTSVLASVALVTEGGASRITMAILVVLALTLRARLFPIPRQRLPLLLSGVLVALLLAGAWVAVVETTLARSLLLLGVAVLAGLVAMAGLVYSKKAPSPWLGRFADILDVVALIALIPYAGYITGFFFYVQGLMASVG
ncbi:type VII secretion integral membrane protein EccD [Allokutzneria sp. A3M-2-11 16]|uniref:type VII secretion integral membrane protein EccD n=1 Tax=Allokutzneria sp. A3M-2-11 16 TaxID=2962043 RepID=UPI0020B6CBE3|nr:type VII secretion integral membrane protein EccD [Allokutzneria sp. A3M-2-11 16]MCP3802592.1 type VII secretion integral membrane protein EccD [Allokutzneria sp. A3M-2-11 16]